MVIVLFIWISDSNFKYILTVVERDVYFNGVPVKWLFVVGSYHVLVCRRTSACERRKLTYVWLYRAVNRRPLCGIEAGKRRRVRNFLLVEWVNLPPRICPHSGHLCILCSLQYSCDGVTCRLSRQTILPAVLAHTLIFVISCVSLPSIRRFLIHGTLVQSSFNRWNERQWWERCVNGEILAIANKQPSWNHREPVLSKRETISR